MNRDSADRPIREKELPEKFASEDYPLLLFAEKLQTGFNQPLLHTISSTLGQKVADYCLP